MFPPIQCSKSSYFTQWLISEYLNRINEPESNSTSSSSTPSLKVTTTESAPTSPPPPPSKSPQQQQNHHHSSNNVFTAKHFKHLFNNHHLTRSKHHHHNHHHHQQPNNNEYKNGGGGTSSSSSHQITTESPSPSIKNIEFIQLLALNALEFTAPIYSFINKSKQQDNHKQHHNNKRSSSVESSTSSSSSSSIKNCKCPSTRSFVQLSGHPGSFAPAGPNTVWKKMPEEGGGTVTVNNSDNNNVVMGLRELLESLDLRRESTSSNSSSIDPPYPNLNPRRTSLFPQQQPDPDTTPVTVFFNSSAATATSSSSTASASASPPLLPPKIYNIPTSLLPNETQVYRKINSTGDPLVLITPKYVTETCYNSQMFLELEDLLTNFSTPNPTIMDIKLGTRTFLESEVKNSKPRPDLYQKLIKLDPSACTEDEHSSQAVTKLTYMLFRETQSSSCSLGFRVEGVKIGGTQQRPTQHEESSSSEYLPQDQLEDVNFKVLKEESDISQVFSRFCKGNENLIRNVVKRLEFIRETMERSDFFMSHEVIGSSLLFIHDDEAVGVWLIDFAKTFEFDHEETNRLTHRERWVMGNREDGVLTGVDNIVRLFRGLFGEGGGGS